MQTQPKIDMQEPSLLLESDLSGLQTNKVVDCCLELLLLAFRLSKASSLDIDTLESLKEKMVNDILSWSSKLSATKQYDEKDIIKLRYCLCILLMKY